MAQALSWKDPHAKNAPAGGFVASPTDYVIQLLQIEIPLLEAIIAALIPPVGSEPTPAIEVVTLVAANTLQPLYASTRPVIKAIIQNISTDPITIFTAKQGVVGGQGIILNAAASIGNAGGSLPVGTVDLSTFSFIGATISDQLAVYYEY